MPAPSQTTSELKRLAAMVCTGLCLPGAALAQDLDAEVMTAGTTLYQDFCAACHGEQGSGTSSGPPLATSSRLQNIDKLVGQTLDGGEYMPGFAFLLSDAEVSAVLTLIRNSWGNDFGPVQPTDAERLR
ncbi:cytochrome c [Marinovum sp.]|uniref:c-type cytochrome n=1 Tax=Marinovum sp. TaxID=2024839 RepID=UPI002B26C26E|nr:cytochrome c [Marinovum sp.]